MITKFIKSIFKKKPKSRVLDLSKIFNDGDLSLYSIANMHEISLIEYDPNFEFPKSRHPVSYRKWTIHYTLTCGTKAKTSIYDMNLYFPSWSNLTKKEDAEAVRILAKLVKFQRYLEKLNAL